MASLQEVKILVMSLVRTNKGGEMGLLELERCYKEQTGTELKSHAAKFSFESVSEMIEKWPEFSVQGFSFSITIRVKVQDHITELNQRSKKTGNKFKGFSKNHQECNPKKRYSGYDPYACSSGSSDKSFKFEKYEHLAKPAVQLRPQPATTSSILVPGKTSVVIVVQEMVNPHRFWFVTYEEYKTIRRMMKRMEEFYSSDNQALHINQNDLHPGHDVAVLYAGIWHRGRVIKIKYSGMITIYFTDYGTVDDVALDNVRVLVGKYLEHPECLKRGILSHVQPVNGIWHPVASERFGKNVLNKKTEAKVRQVNDSDASHVLAIRTMSEKLLLADELILMDYCVCDRDFGAIKSNSLAFADYEKGKHYEQPETPDEDSWSPTKPCATTLQHTKELAPPVEAKLSNNQLEACSAVANEINRLKIAEKPQPKIVEVSQPKVVEMPRPKIVELHQPKIVEVPQPEISKRQSDPKTQRLVKGAKEKICIYSIADDNTHFFFFLCSEFENFCDYRNKLEVECRGGTKLNDDFSIGAHVAVMQDNNYCRGRIITKTGNGDNFLILLIDFGDNIERPRNLIFKLQSQWMDRPAAAIRGKLADNVVKRSQQKLLKEGRLKITEARIMEVDEDVAQLFLL